MYSPWGELLTWTGDTVRWWKEHFEELLNPVNTFSVEEAEPEDSGEASSISVAEVTKVVKKLLGRTRCGRDPP